MGDVERLWHHAVHRGVCKRPSGEGRLRKDVDASAPRKRVLVRRKSRRRCAAAGMGTHFSASAAGKSREQRSGRSFLRTMVGEPVCRHIFDEAWGKRGGLPGGGQGRGLWLSG